MKPHFISALMSSAVILSACGGGGSSSTPTPTPAPVSPAPPANTAPVLSQPNANQTAFIGSAFEYDATQNGATFSDADGDTLSYAVSFGAAANGFTASDGIISGTPSQAGRLTVTVTARDGNGGDVSDVFDVVVNSGAPSGKPNILFVLTDDHGKDASAEYSLSADIPSTPNFSALANDGLVFDNLWVSPSCSPTRAALISGRYGHQTNVLTPGNALPASEIVLQSFLKTDSATSDYTSALIGKWHLGGGQTGPNDFGIDHFAGITGGGVSDYFDWDINVNGTTTTTTSYATSELTDQAIDWVSAQTQPWFLWLAYNAPHTPFHLPPANLHGRNLSGTTADINANQRAYYLAAIEAMDTEFGRLMNSLPEAVRENTIVIFIGDNGTPTQVKDQSVAQNGAKGSLFQGGVNTPMFMSGAGITRRGERENAIITQTDFFPTVVELAGGTLSSYQDGQSFLTLLTNPALPQRDYSYTTDDGGWTIRNETHKLIQNNNGSQDLFDMIADPAETADLLNSGEDVSAILTELSAEANRIRGE